MLGSEGKFGKAFGLTNDWAFRIIKHVGNYGEIFERTSARARRSRSSAGKTRSGRRAACNTRRRSDKPQPQLAPSLARASLWRASPM